MILKELLTDKPIKIMVRTYDPDGNSILFGYCRWDGEKLISLDGDTYCLDDEVVDYFFTSNGVLVYWFEGEWI